MLAKTTNLIRLFLYAQGETEVPPQFFLWAFLSTMAACVADRVYVRKLAGSPVYANLYTLLVGPAGCGKGTAINAVTKLVRDIPQVNLYEGALTGPAMFKWLHKVKKKKDDNGNEIGSKAFIVMEELAMDVPSGRDGEQFIKYLVGLWEPKQGKFQKQTIVEGGYTLEDRCINWLAGSTRDWLVDVISAKDMRAGWARRCVAIEGHIDPTIRISHPKLPEDYDEVMEHITIRMQLLAETSGEIVKTPGALAWEDWWYHTRPAYKDDDDIPRWRQEQDLMNKLAIMLVLADGGALVMKRRHLEQALELVAEAQEGLPRLLEYARTLDSGLLSEVLTIIRSHPGLTWGELVAFSGLMAKRLQQIVATLVQAGKVYTFTGTDGKLRYSTHAVFQPKNKPSRFHPTLGSPAKKKLLAPEPLE